MARPPFTENSVRDVLMDPRNAGALGHEQIISPAQWVEANALLITQMGAEAYLKRLLALLSDHSAGE